MWVAFEARAPGVFRDALTTAEVRASAWYSPVPPHDLDLRLKLSLVAPDNASATHQTYIFPSLH